MKAIKTNVTVYIGHSAPTTPETEDIVGFAYDMTVVYGNGKSYRYHRCTPVKGKTNNQLDLLAMVFSLQALKQPATVTFVTDSKYILDTFKKLRKYVQDGWKTRTGSEVANQDGWKCLIDTAKKGGHHFAIEKAEGLSVYQVSNCHLEANKAINLRLMEDLQPKAKAVPTPEAKAAPSPSAKSEPAPKAAQTPQAVQELPASKRGDIPRAQLEQLHEEALSEHKPLTKNEQLMLDLQMKGKERFSE